jgi:AcrR family transcriptional regulator
MPRPLIPHRRERILDTAEAFILERGFDATTIQDIAERAGIAKGAVYREFESKEALLHEVIARSADRLWNEFARRVEASGARRLSQIYRLGMTALSAEPIMLAAYTDDRGTLGSYVDHRPRRYENRLRRTTEYLGELQKTGALRADLDVDAATRALASLSIGLAYAGELLGGMTADRFNATVGVIADMIENGLETGVESSDPEALRTLLGVVFAGGPRDPIADPGY